MSVEGCFLRVLPEEIGLLHACSLVTFEQFMGYLGDGLRRENTCQFLGVDRDCQVLLFLLGAAAEPLLDSLELSKASFGRGFIRYWRSSDVPLVATALNKATQPTLRGLFDPTQLEAQQVYPGNWSLYQDEPLLSKRFESIWAAFENLVRLFDGAATANECVIYWLM